VNERKIEMILETYEVLLIKQRDGLSRSWCARCRKQVALIGMDEAYLAGLSKEAIFQREEIGRIHLVEVTGGPPLICLNSLIQT